MGPGPAVNSEVRAVMYFVAFWLGVSCTIMALILWDAHGPGPRLKP